MVDNSPPITIVTVSYNAEAAIQKTIDSVQSQSYEAIEHIIIDGQSTDNTLPIILSYGDRIQKVVSEPDKGIYDAMNKGLQLARGEWVIFLNAGDYFNTPDSLADVAGYLTDDADVVYSDVVSDYGSFKKTLIAPDAADLLGVMKNGMGICHNATIFRTVLHQATPYNTSYKIAADYDVMLSLIEKGAVFSKYSHSLSVIETGAGVSYRNRIATLREHRRIIASHPHSALSLFFNGVDIVLALVKMGIKKLLSQSAIASIIRLKP